MRGSIFRIEKNRTHLRLRKRIREEVCIEGGKKKLRQLTYVRVCTETQDSPQKCD